MAYGAVSPADVAKAWASQSWTGASSFACSFVYHNFDKPQDLLVVLDLLDRVRLGFFMAVHLVPPASSWSRARHVEGGQWPSRSRAQPLGLSVLSAVDRQRVLQSNQVLEVTSWVAHHALCCQVSKVYLLFMMPEDFGGHCESAPLLHGIYRSFVDCREQVMLFEERLSYAVLRKRNKSTLLVSLRTSQVFETSYIWVGLFWNASGTY